MKKHPAELRADLQAYYGLNIDDMGYSFTHAHAAACIATLPLGSRLLTAIHGAQCAWTITDYRIHFLACVMAGKEIPYPWERHTAAGLPEFDSMPIDELRKWRDSKMRG